MSRIDRSQGDLVIRAILGAIPLAVCWWFGRGLEDSWMRVGLMIPGLTATALIVFPSWTAAIGFQVTKIYMPWDDEKIRRVVPLHAVDTMLQREEWDAAETRLFRVAREYGGSRAIWERLFEMLWTKVGDPTRAARAHRRALSIVADGAERELVSRLYLVHAERVLDDEAFAREEVRVAQQREIVETEVASTTGMVGKRASDAAWRAASGRFQEDPTGGVGVSRVER